MPSGATGGRENEGANRTFKPPAVHATQTYLRDEGQRTGERETEGERGRVRSLFFSLSPSFEEGRKRVLSQFAGGKEGRPLSLSPFPSLPLIHLFILCFFFSFSSFIDGSTDMAIVSIISSLLRFVVGSPD